jgi:hypothetical protein
MITLNREMTFINWYILQKEFTYSDNVRKILNLVHYLNTKKRMDLALAIHISNEKSKKDYNYHFSKKFIWNLYSKRLAHIKHAKEEYKKFVADLRKSNLPEVKYSKLCACGCGKEVKENKTYANGHNPRFKSEEEKIDHVERMNYAKRIKNNKKVILLKQRS